MFGFGPWELVLVLILVIFFFGGRKLPQIGDGLGRGITEFKKAIRGTSQEETKAVKPVAPGKSEIRSERDSTSERAAEGERRG